MALFKFGDVLLIHLVTEQGMTRMGHVYAYLMRSAGFKIKL